MMSSSDEGIHEVLEVEQVPDLLVVALDGRLLRLPGLELAGTLDQPACRESMAGDHEDFAEDSRRREQRGSNRVGVVDQESHTRATRDRAGAEAHRKCID